MYRFFVEESQIYDGTVHITGSDVNHIKNVLRMRPGEKILVSTGGEKEYHCAVSDFPEGEVLAAVEEVTAADRELPSGIVLFQGLPKGDKMELIIQKAVELGATEIVPVEMKRCVVKLDRKKAEKKAERCASNVIRRLQNLRQSSPNGCRFRRYTCLLHFSRRLQ